MDYLFLDPGSSGTKILTSSKFCCGYFVEPGVELVPTLNEEAWEEERWAKYEFGAGVVELAGQTYRVGNRPVTCLSSEMKYVGAIVKSIAAIASMDWGRGESYLLSTLLPLDEYSSRKAFAQGVRNGIAQARFNGKPVNAKIETIRVSPEGSGLMFGKEGIHVAIMVGHTDVSLVRFESGRVNLTQSQTFSRVGVGAIAASLGIPGGDAYVATAISKGRFKDLASCGIPERDIRQAESDQRREFVKQQIEPHLRAYSWEGVKSVVIGGGGSAYLKQDIAQMIPLKLKKATPPKGLRLFGDHLDIPRYCDIYGMAYRELSEVIAVKLKGEPVQSVECEVV